MDASVEMFALTAWGICDPRFARLDDAACHQACIDNWDLRDEFIAYYNANCRDEIRINRRGHVCYRTDWFEVFASGMMGVAAVFLLPALPILEFLPDSCFLQLFVSLAFITVLVSSAVIASQWLGVIWGLSLVGAIWLALDAIALLYMHNRFVRPFR
jgi:hypothetical protein